MENIELFACLVLFLPPHTITQMWSPCYKCWANKEPGSHMDNCAVMRRFQLMLLTIEKWDTCI